MVPVSLTAASASAEQGHGAACLTYACIGTTARKDGRAVVLSAAVSETPPEFP